MPVDFETMLFLQTQDVFSLVIEITPVTSQPGQATYSNRGIFNTVDIVTQTEFGPVVSDQKDIIDILIGEYPFPPMQGDRIHIPVQAGVSSGVPGDYEVVSTATNGVGQITLDVRRFETP
jgi:hypothetical protein